MVRAVENHPWLAVGCPCPSELLTSWLLERRDGQISPLLREARIARARMSTRERCAYEVGLYVEFLDFAGGRFREPFNRWLGACGTDLETAVLEGWRG